MIRGDPSDPPLEQCPFCGKKGHLSWSHAERVRKRRKRSGGKGLNIYLCRKSGLWHLGRKIDGRKRMRYDRREEKREMRDEVKMDEVVNFKIPTWWLNRTLHVSERLASLIILNRNYSGRETQPTWEDLCDSVWVLDCPPPNELVGVEYAAFNQGEVA